tara:strand:+ start:312 stop:1610 length:1299 start_codon:yes stop_codon:yes gene_type:complete
MKKTLQNYFELEAKNTSIKRELLAGATTFITMVYIIFVNPTMMAETGMDYGASFVGTCLAAAVACFAMGVLANWPVALAPGMGLNAFFTYTVVGEMGYSWQVALSAVFIAGVLFFVISVTPLRRWILESIPSSLRISMGAGIGLFIGFIGLKSSGIIVSNPVNYVSLGDLTKAEPYLGLLGFLIITVLSIRKIPGAIMLGIITITVISILANKVEFSGFFSSPPSLAPVLFELDFSGALNVGIISVVLTFLFVNLFDTAGTLLAVATSANLIDDKGRIENLDQALKADSASSIVGTMVGCAPVTSYVESSAGVSAGGRSGLTAVFVGCFFCLAIFISPLASIIPAYATAGALIYVAMIMLGGLEKLEWSDQSELIPALITVSMIPLSFSIADGIALGFMSYVIIKVFTGRRDQVTSAAWFLAGLFALRYLFI